MLPTGGSGQRLTEQPENQPDHDRQDERGGEAAERLGRPRPRRHPGQDLSLGEQAREMLVDCVSLAEVALLGATVKVAQARSTSWFTASSRRDFSAAIEPWIPYSGTTKLAMASGIKPIAKAITTGLVSANVFVGTAR